MISNRVQKLIKPMGNGVCNPLLAEVLCGKESFFAVIKTKGNPEGHIALINEWIAYQIAQKIKLLMPESGLIVLDSNVQISEECSKFFSPESIGTCFFSKLINHVTPLSEGSAKFINNKEMFERLILFDHLIFNKDRNPGNLFMETTKKSHKMYAIDHTHAFKNGVIWDSNCFLHGQKENDYLSHEILSYNNYIPLIRNKVINAYSLSKETEYFQNLLSANFFTKCTKTLPTDWQVSNKDLIELVRYLSYRLHHLPDICQVIIQYWS